MTSAPRGGLRSVLRRLALRTLRSHESLPTAMAAMKFVQFDPIQAPAFAQDLILRQRVPGYRAGDLAGAYSKLGLDEDYLHVYGAMTPELLALVQPRRIPTRYRHAHDADLDDDEAAVYALIRTEGPASARDVASRLSRTRARNVWGGTSLTSTQALDRLHFGGLLRVQCRRGGQKVYALADRRPLTMAPDQRAIELTRWLFETLAPITASGLRSAVAQLRRNAELPFDPAATIRTVLELSTPASASLDSVTYYWPADWPTDACPSDDTARFLAPFDPLVWDRRRFEALWGWAYRFEAYLPRNRRQFGYYALPVLWRDEAVGVANVDRTPSGKLQVELRLRDPVLERRRGFRSAFSAEFDRLEVALVTQADDLYPRASGPLTRRRAD